MNQEERCVSKLEGIFSKGYGILPKSVLADPGLTPEAKVLYAYFSVIGGNGGGYQPCPPEGAILHSLDISHARYLRHRKSLTDAGLMEFVQQRGSGGRQLFEGAMFLLVKCAREDASLSQMAALQEGIFQHGFGILPRAVMLDASLSIEAKAAYSFLCVYAAASIRSERQADVASSLIASKLMGRKRVQAAMNELIEKGYIDRTRNHDGVFGSFSYRLLFHVRPRMEIEGQAVKDGLLKEAAQEAEFDAAEKELQEVKNDTTENAKLEVDFDTTEKPLEEDKNAEKPNVSRLDILEKKVFVQGKNETAEKRKQEVRFVTTKNETTENDTAVYINNTNFNNTKISNRSNQSSRWKPMADCMEDAEVQLEAQILRSEFDRDLVDGIVMLVAEVYAMPANELVRIGGRDLSAGTVKEIFGRLRFAHVEYVIQSLKHADGTDIGNKKAYLLTCLYNAPATLGMDTFFAVHR